MINHPQSIKLYEKDSNLNLQSAIMADLAGFTSSENWYVSETNLITKDDGGKWRAIVVFQRDVYDGTPTPMNLTNQSIKTVSEHPHVYSAVLVSNLEVVAPIDSNPGLIVPIPFPDGPNNIGIFAIVCRMQFTALKTPNLYGATWSILRTSDNAIIGGVALASPVEVVPSLKPDGTLEHVSLLTPPFTSQEMINWSPNFFTLNTNDTLFGIVRTYESGTETVGDYKARVYAFAFYYRLDANGNPT